MQDHDWRPDVVGRVVPRSRAAARHRRDAQLASQTALVGTVTDSGGLVLPGAQVVAVNVGTKDTYEATTNAEGYYNIQFVRTGTYDITVTLSGFQTFKATGVEVANNQVVRTNAVDAGRRRQRVGERRGRGAGARHRQRHGLGNDRRARDRRAAAERPQRVEPGQHDAGRPRRPEQRHRPQLPRRRASARSRTACRSTASTPRPTCWRRPACGRSPTRSTEIQVQTGSTSAEYGSYLGVHINVVTKSGTNTPHGSLFDFFQDDALDSRGYFENPALPEESARPQPVRRRRWTARS